MNDLIFDRTTSDVTNRLLKGNYNASDLNRVEEWCRYLADELNNMGYSITITTKTDWTHSGSTGSLRKSSDMTRIKNNILALMTGFHWISQIYGSVDNWNITKANRWEKILYEIYCMMGSVKNYDVYSGIANSGEPRLWQNKFLRTYDGFPRTYKTIPYCQSTGTQYINLDTYSCNDERIVIDFEFTALGQCYIYGNNYSTHLMSVGLDANNNFTYQYNGTLTTTNTTAVVGTRYVLDLTLKNGTQTLKINGAVAGTSTIADTNRAYSSNKQGLFYKRASSSSARLPASIKLYSCRIYNFDVLYQDIIPAKNSSDVVCLYEQVYNKFYTNAGTGDFITEGDQPVGEYQLTTEAGQGITTEGGEAIDYESVPYTMLDWIEGTSTQWINTGIVPSSTIKIETKASGLTGGSSINGSEYTSSYRYKWGINGSSPYIGYAGSNYNISGQTVNLSTPYTYYISSGSQWIKDKDGNTIHQSTTGNLSRYSSTPIYLFACNSGSTNNIASQMMRLYYCKIWDGDTLVRDFIPVIDANNVVCLYDKVSQAYFYNQGEESFIPSETITYKTFAYVGTNAEGYINTGFKPDNNTRVRTEFEFLTAPTSTWEFLFGSRDNYHVAEFTCAYNSSSWYTGFATADQRPTSPERAINTTYRIDKNKNSFSVNGTTTTNTSGTFTGSYNMVFFGNVANGTFGGNSHAKCYYFKIYNNGTLTKDFIPVLRKSDNVPCFYDLVNNEFYTNAGTGTFLYG